jgi:hypothetical protein
MAGVAEHSVGVVCGNNLRKAFGLGGAGRVATGAENGCVEQYGLNCGRVVGAGVLGLRSVASFAVYMRMFSLALLVNNVGVTGFAGIVSGIPHRVGGDFANGCAPVVAILPKALWHYVMSHHKKHHKGEDEEPRKPE